MVLIFYPAIGIKVEIFGSFWCFTSWTSSGASPNLERISGVPKPKRVYTTRRPLATTMMHNMLTVLFSFSDFIWHLPSEMGCSDAKKGITACNFVPFTVGFLMSFTEEIQLIGAPGYDHIGKTSAKSWLVMNN
jgi:hypothetical protein